MKIVRSPLVPTVWVGTRFACPECGLDLPVFDHGVCRAWRHLDSGPFQTWVHARLPRVACLWHGTRQIHVPWALPRSQFTTAFERWAIDVLRETDVLGATRLLQISWEEAWGLMERAVVRGRSRKRARVVACLGVDEKAIAKGHSYFTVVSDWEAGTVEYVAEDRTQESLRDLWCYQRRGWGERHWRRWYFWATHSRLTPVIQVANLVRRHLPNILTYYEHPITNAVSEGLNGKIQAIKKTLMGSGTGSTSRWPFTSTAEGSTYTRPRNSGQIISSPREMLPGKSP